MTDPTEEQSMALAALIAVEFHGWEKDAEGERWMYHDHHTLRAEWTGFHVEGCSPVVYNPAWNDDQAAVVRNRLMVREDMAELTLRRKRDHTGELFVHCRLELLHECHERRASTEAFATVLAVASLLGLENWEEL